jgi:hypothetical protein
MICGLALLVGLELDDMRFCCPKCGRDEEILSDREPRCLFCGVGMIGASDYSELWMSPYTAIVRMRTISEKYGTERARVDRRFKREREAWTTGVFALALSKLNDQDWWVEVETIENTPDTKLHAVDQGAGHNVIQTRSIEIVDWEENVEDIMEVIGKKCQRAYPGHFILVVSARHGGKELHVDQMIGAMKKMRSPFLEAWVVGVVGLNHMTALRVAPSGLEIDLVSAELEKARKQSPFLKRGIRGTIPGFRELGSAFLPIP